MSNLFLNLIKIYQKTKPFRVLVFNNLPLFSVPLATNTCRYTPSCSQYASESFDKHGVIKGLFLSTKRLFKCHPWSKGGIDPVVS